MADQPGAGAGLDLPLAPAPPAPPPARSPSLLGARLELVVEGVAAGGSCVARHGPSGRVVFVRHTLPGERVVAVVTEDRGGSFLRADAVEVLDAAPDRVAAPCRYARPGGCGGCDWQHATGAAQRALKAQVIRDQFTRIAGIDVTSLLREVHELPGGLTGWRTRVSYAVGPDARPGLRRHASHEVVPVDRCLLGVPGVGDGPQLDRRRPGLSGVELVDDGAGGVSVVAHRPGSPRPGGRRPGRGRRPADRTEVVYGSASVRRPLAGREFDVAADGFWQVHPAAGPALADAVLSALQPRAGETALDLYAGAGALTAVLAAAVGPTGRVVGLEGDAGAVRDATHNLRDTPWAQVRRGRIDAAAVALLEVRPDVVVLDPPRTGAGPDTLRTVVGLAPRAVGYVSCDPATLARDVRAVVELGWELTGLAAFDAFPMTHHVECVALLLPRRV